MFAPRAVPIAIAAAALLAGGAACNRKSEAATELPPASGPGAPERPALPSLAPPPAAASTIAATSDETTGTTWPKDRAEVGPNMSGVLAMVAVDEGDRVRKGDLLFRVRSDDARLAVQQAEAALESAKVRMRAVQVEYDRTKRLFEQNAIDQAQWDRVQAEYEGARAFVEQAEVGLAMAKKHLADTAVRSPLTGVVTARLKNPGEMVTMMPPAVVVVVEDHATLELRFRLPERAIAGLAPGHVVHAEFDAVGQKRDAKIARISPSVDPQTRTVEVVADIPNADGSLRSGMLAKIRLAEGEREDR